MRLLSTATALVVALGAASLGAQGARPIAPAAQQIAAAVSVLPRDMRDGATVWGYSAAGQLVKLRDGAGDMNCLATDPKASEFHVACYHKSLEPFMARGRALRAQGVKDAQVDTVRFAEIKAGKLAMPSHPAAMYQVFGGTFDAATGGVKGGNALYVVYIPFATAASTGLSTKPTRDGPWLMFPGTPKAHIMFTAGM